MSAMERGIVLDAETAAVVPDIGRWVDGNGEEWGYIPEFEHHVEPGDILTHIGGRPVAELVATHDEAKERAERLRAVAPWVRYDDMAPCWTAADLLDRCADLLIDARLVAAAHAQWAEARPEPQADPVAALGSYLAANRED